MEADERAKLLPMHLLRPCVGKGKGRHIYTADMLQENAANFSGWRQYIDHLSPEARRAARGLPRSIRDLGGRIVESYWDPNVPADPKAGFGQGAVVGWSLPTPFIRELAENDPELVEASISANATGVKPTMHDGQRAWLVEGIEPKGSVDWVTEAGAGGKIVALMEAAYSEEEDGMGLIEAMTDEEFIAYVEETRPHLLEETAAPVEVEEADSKGDDPDADGEDDDDDDDVVAMATRLRKKNPKLTEAQATAMAKKALSEALNKEDDDMGDITPAALQEALRSEDLRGAMKELVEAAVAEERELIRAEARADAERQLTLRDLRDEAHKMIQEARLPDAFANRAKAQFTLSDDGPSKQLDVVDEVDDEGKVTKTARTKLQEAATAAIADQRELLAAANPTRVTGQGPANAARSGEDGEAPKKGEGTFYASVLQEAGVDPATAWDD